MFCLVLADARTNFIHEAEPVHWFDRPLTHMALLVSAVPLSLTTILSLLREPIRRPSSRATRPPESEVSATAAKHSRVLSKIARIRKRRPQANLSKTKSSDRLSLGRSGTEDRRP